MLNKRMLGLGIVGIGVLCMLLTATAKVSFYADFTQDLTGWTVSKEGSGDVQRQSNVHHDGTYSLLIDSPDKTSQAWTWSPSMYPFDGTKSYTLTMWVKLVDSSNYYLYLPYNGQIKCFIAGNDDNAFTSGRTLWYDHGNGITKVCDIPTGSWNLWKFEVNPANKQYEIYINGYKLATAGFCKDNAIDQLYMGDDTTNDNYGTVYVDSVKVVHSGQSVLDLMETFESGDLGQWSTSCKSSGTVGATNADSKDLSDKALYIYSPSGTNSKAWVFTPSYSFDKNKGYTVSMFIRVPNTDNNYLYVPYNGHIKCMIGTQDSGKGSTLYSISGNTRTEVKTLDTGKWYYLKFDVRPLSKQYDIYIDNKRVATSVTTDSASANAFLAFGDDSIDANYGTVYIDDIRVDQ